MLPPPRRRYLAFWKIADALSWKVLTTQIYSTEGVPAKLTREFGSFVSSYCSWPSSKYFIWVNEYRLLRKWNLITNFLLELNFEKPDIRGNPHNEGAILHQVPMESPPWFGCPCHVSVDRFSVFLYYSAHSTKQHPLWWCSQPNK